MHPVPAGIPRASIRSLVAQVLHSVVLKYTAITAASKGLMRRITKRITSVQIAHPAKTKTWLIGTCPACVPIYLLFMFNKRKVGGLCR